MEDREVTLLEMLDFRERKAMYQEKLSHLGEESLVVSLGMNIPGPLKRTSSVFRVFNDGRRMIEKTIGCAHGTVGEKIIMEENAGYAAIYQVIGVDAYLLKKKMVCIEEKHPCGRLFDIDVYGMDGYAITREQVGAAKRKCLLCDSEAKVCGRSRAHSIKELSEQVWKIIDRYQEVCRCPLDSEHF